jgi:hypothetical protein
MPYGIRKVPNEDLYYVYNKETKSKFSKLPLNKETAMAQVRALYANEGMEYKEKKKIPGRSRVLAGSDEAKEKMRKVREAKLNK